MEPRDGLRSLGDARLADETRLIGTGSIHLCERARQKVVEGSVEGNMVCYSLLVM